MKDAILRWCMYFVAILIVGPVAFGLLWPLRTADGGADATPLISTTPLLGLLAALAALVLALVAGLLTAKVARSVRGGMIAAGLVLVWAAFGTAEVDDLVRAARSAAPLWMLSLEGVLIGAAGVAAAAILVLFGGGAATGDDPSPSTPPALQKTKASQYRTAPPSRAALRGFFGDTAPLLLAVAAGVLAGGAAAFFAASSPLKGQAIAAALLGAVAAAVAGRLTNPGMSLPALMLPIAILAVISPVAGAILGGGGAAIETVYGGTLLPIAHILPLDWLAGAFIGIPLGAGWAGSMVEKQATPPAGAPSTGPGTSTN
jgi:hypothetical protein